MSRKTDTSVRKRRQLNRKKLREQRRKSAGEQIKNPYKANMDINKLIKEIQETHNIEWGEVYDLLREANRKINPSAATLHDPRAEKVQEYIDEALDAMEQFGLAK